MKLPLRPTASPLPTGESDADLLCRLTNREPAAFTVLVRRWESAAYRVAFRITGDHAAAEDVRQSVFLKLWEKSASIVDPERLGAWLRRSVVNESINLVRREKRRRRIALGETGASGVASRETPPEERLSASEEAVRLGRALEAMDAGDRALLSLRFDEELTFRDIAAVLRRPVSTVKAQVQRAVERLRLLLAKEHR